jgi:hypothetical protein
VTPFRDLLVQLWIDTSQATSEEELLKGCGGSSACGGGMDRNCTCDFSCWFAICTVALGGSFILLVVWWPLILKQFEPRSASAELILLFA